MNFNTLIRKQTTKPDTADNFLNADANGLKRTLKLRDLTAMGIAAIIGAGIFSTIGTAASNGGPAVSLLFIFTAIACGFSALCYAQFASTIPVSGSAYTYSYHSLGEIFAWIIGWDLIMEYAVGNIAVAISWSDYFTSLCHNIGLSIPSYLSIDYLSASRGYQATLDLLKQGIPIDKIQYTFTEAYSAWNNAPMLFGVKIIADIPAFTIVAIITMLVYVGINETKIANNIMVILKLAILLVVITIGAFYINPQNWVPFAPHGVGGVLKGISAVFFAYIGFDAISTTAEECKNPKRDLPRSMIYSLLICTVLYILISLVLTGMTSYKFLAVGDPLSFVFEQVNVPQLSIVIAVSAIIAMASVLLVFQVGQPRIWMSMSRDGLLPKIFSKIHIKFKTPSFATIVTGIVVAVPTLFMNLTEVTDLTSIGTLFAFIMVCSGVLFTHKKTDKDNKQFRLPYYNSRYFLMPILLLITIIVIVINYDSIVNFDWSNNMITFISNNIPFVIFLIISIALSICAVIYSLSLIPVLGLLINIYLILQLGITNWARFLIWLIVGLIIYFVYGIKKSKLNKKYLNY